MANPVLQNIESLKRAQSFDSEIHQTRLLLAEIPESRAALARELESKRVHLTIIEQTQKDMQLKLKEKEIELAQKEAQIKKLDGQLSQIKTNKEYNALLQEIASLKADNSLLEEEIIRKMDEVEAVKDEVLKEKDRFAGITREHQAKDQELVNQEKNLQSRLQEITKQRQEIIGQLPPEVGDLYNRIVQKKEGLALAPVSGEFCSACQMQLRPQVINELQIGEQIITCENCSRILFYES
ncbi:MAG: putative zinc ribbon domain protein [Candidatus Omnitrophica bacterium ADurb.Bin314]|nr:MAG: putative zinc ribbon domain protein [Candidatus Omnitrophica bacterium ADurb.Bin314]HOE68694.1 C4-type zinc ribbon domain-containing protein [Candidatus Omnitrophota bacterium]